MSWRAHFQSCSAYCHNVLSHKAACRPLITSGLCFELSILSAELAGFHTVSMLFSGLDQLHILVHTGQDFVVVVPQLFFDRA